MQRLLLGDIRSHGLHVNRKFIPPPLEVAQGHRILLELLDEGVHLVVSRRRRLLYRHVLEPRPQHISHADPALGRPPVNRAGSDCLQPPALLVLLPHVQRCEVVRQIPADLALRLTVIDR